MTTQRSDVLVVMRRAEGALVRLLGTTVRRGFEPIRFESVLAQSGTLRIRMLVDGCRPIETLVQQLLKLYDVERVEVRPDSETSVNDPP